MLSLENNFQKMNEIIYDVIIVGAGPAGLTAGIYASRAKFRTLILNEGTIGGQLVLTHEIANYPGVEPMSGYQLATTMKKQALAFGCEIRSNVKVTGYDFKSNLKKVEINGSEAFYGKTVILSPGGLPRTLDIPGEKEFKGKGVSYCATCDGDFFTGKEIVVVGGGNSALEEAVSLTKYATKVTVVHQFDHFQAFPHAIEEARSNPRIGFIMESKLCEIAGEDSVNQVKIEQLSDRTILEQKTDGIFIFIGYLANTKGLEEHISLNKNGEIIVDPDMRTNIPGVFAAGDCTAKRYRQVTTAVGDGTVAALNALEFIRLQQTTN
jgi:thioredoxin reductase (NADPH)